jgi:hypothetical protein
MVLSTYRDIDPDLTDEETATLVWELDRIIQNDRYPLSPES